MLSKFKSYRLNEVFVRKNNASCDQFSPTIYSLLPHFIKQPVRLNDTTIKSASINRAQLNCALKWQCILHKAATTVTLCLALLGISSVSYAASKTILGVPTTIQSEDFINAGGVKNLTSSDVGGGSVTGSISSGDWMSYVHKEVNLPASGYYIISYRVASPEGGGSFVFSNIGKKVTDIETVSVPKTGSWPTWVTIHRKVRLKSGRHYFGIRVLNGGFQLNWFRIALASDTTTSVASSAVSSKASSSKSSSSSSSKKSSVASSTKSSTSAALDPLYTRVAGPVGLSWLAPKQREDKTVLDITELGGYQLRYKVSTAKTYTYITINDPWTRTYNFDWLEGDYVFQIAAFDKLGVLSDFAYFID